MIPAIHIKKTIDLNKGFRSLLEVLKLVAVSEYHILEKRLRFFERFHEALEAFFGSVNLDAIRHPFLQPGAKPTGIVAVTSDAGLLGGINSQVISRATALLYESEPAGKFVVIGERGQAYVQGMGIPHTFFPGIVDARRYGQACEVRDYLIEEMLSGRIGGLKIVYPRAHSFVIHRVEAETIVPFTHEKPAAEASAIKASADKQEELILESAPAEVLEYLVYLVLGQRLYEIFGMSRLCEQAARFVHLEESCQKIQEMNQKLLLQYFRRRHEIIDANMRELFAARSLYAK